MIKLFMIVNEDRFFLSHRKEIAIVAKQQGYDVTIVCKDTGQKQEIINFGLKVIDLPINPTGENIFQEMKTMYFLYKLYKKEKPDIVHHVGLKNILWGSIAAKLSHVKGVVNAVSGLGVLFTGNKLSLKTKAILKVLHYSNKRKNVIFIFQNNEDETLFNKYHITTKNNSVFIKGSGVNLKEYNYIPTI